MALTGKPNKPNIGKPVTGAPPSKPPKKHTRQPVRHTT